LFAMNTECAWERSCVSPGRGGSVPSNGDGVQSKNGERRTIPLNQTALDLLKHKHGNRSVGTELVFLSEAQTRLNASNISLSLNLALKKAKMIDFHFHDLRHTCATRMDQAGVDLYKVQRLLRHKLPLMT